MKFLKFLSNNCHPRANVEVNAAWKSTLCKRWAAHIVRTTVLTDPLQA